jgi:hypothetical protein
VSAARAIPPCPPFFARRMRAKNALRSSIARNTSQQACGGGGSSYERHGHSTQAKNGLWGGVGPRRPSSRRRAGLSRKEGNDWRPRECRVGFAFWVASLRASLRRSERGERELSGSGSPRSRPGSMQKISPFPQSLALPFQNQNDVLPGILDLALLVEVVAKVVTGLERQLRHPPQHRADFRRVISAEIPFGRERCRAPAAINHEFARDVLTVPCAPPRHPPPSPDRRASVACSPSSQARDRTPPPDVRAMQVRPSVGRFHTPVRAPLAFHAASLHVAGRHPQENPTRARYPDRR